MTKTPDGHIIAHDDHGLTAEHLAFIDTLLTDWDGSFVILHKEMPKDCPDLMSALYGPSAGDYPVHGGNKKDIFSMCYPRNLDIRYRKRGNRRGKSRLLVGFSERPCRKMVVIAGPGRDEPIIYTAYGSPVVAPREPWDARTDEERKECEAFWGVHALAVSECESCDGTGERPPGPSIGIFIHGGHGQDVPCAKCNGAGVV